MAFLKNEPNKEKVDTEHMYDEELREYAIKSYENYTNSYKSSIRESFQNKDVNFLVTNKEKILSELKEQFTNDGFSDEQIEILINSIISKFYQYDILDKFIQNEDISDIKVYNFNNIRIKVRGVRQKADVSFKDEKEYRDFVTRILERNNINFGTANANQTFTDDTQPFATLRISCISELLCDEKVPCIAIRKIEKEKRSLKELSTRGMFDKEKRAVKENTSEDNNNISQDITNNEEINNLIPKLVSSRGLLFTGKGASGKTTLMNALLDLIPKDESVMLCQENSELFMSDHPDTLRTHVLTNNGDSKISYNLSDLTRMGLLIDLDRIIVGEVKQSSEAEALSKASMTGHKCWTSVHGENCRMAIDKMADYISQANINYSFIDSLKQLLGFEYVIHLSNFQVDEIVHIDAWDNETKSLKTTTIYSLY